MVNRRLTENDTEAMRKDYSSDRSAPNGTKSKRSSIPPDPVNTTCAATSWMPFSMWSLAGCQWRMLPGGFAPWQTVYYYFRTWKKRGAIERLLSVARRGAWRGARREAGREPEPSAVTEEFLVIDCQSVPITRSGGLCGFDGNKKVKGRKRHIAVDT